MYINVSYNEIDSVKRLKLQNEKLKKFIRNQGFNPSDLNWVSIDEI